MKRRSPSHDAALKVIGNASGTVLLGIDPGSVRTGYGVVALQGRQPRYLASGCIRPEAKVFPARLAEIYHGVSALIEEFAPVELAIEEVFLARNPQSALKLGQARGVAIAAAVAAGLPVREYAARVVKQTVVGTGAATKAQVQHMVRILLDLDAMPPSDSADALALAICHINTARP